ncbi:Nitrilase/cyanide hydratase and apolipoprotein N-acyltransferase [Ferroglobus placidus DSM 10642]|uniref:Nitrilase/cyanide hydratase and apolipoprotein N-acyltransferase n=1 Tax=Ferroglobus placidus (strain DSM 10642 / AEDII12DO) TaxID=589924 RepID=D3RZ20_FERPA|nr:nitrilase-related carbon-nitrogen hydrolase [Ferroglobus placidus]ADC65733.1 Nitrilase/cyanide hydratase and apolipoprotein N-acyltransferase [Ferroglobus placidus DSM 10642]
MIVAVAQQRIVEDVEVNKMKALSLVKRAIQHEAKIVVLPEASNTGLFPENFGKVRSLEEELDLILKLSERKDILVIAGVVERSEGNLFNSVALIYRGEVIGKYSKILLFPLNEERKYLTAGKELKVFETDFGKIGVLVCYEVRFPEMARKLMKMGAEILAVPAEFPAERIEHWRTLLRARAIENQFYVLGANCVSPDGFYGGNSMIVDPMGNVVNEAGNLQEIIIGEVNLEYVRRVREEYPFLKDLDSIP